MPNACSVLIKLYLKNLFHCRCPLSAEASARCRDTLSKTLYYCLREGVIAKVNSAIKTVKVEKCISILDMPGFGNVYFKSWFNIHFKIIIFIISVIENFQKNSFEQLVINFANEKIQKFCIEHLIDNMNPANSDEPDSFLFLPCNLPVTSKWNVL